MMKKWYKYFSKKIITRGKEYYDNDRVSFVSKGEGDSYKFLVYGNTGAYNVRINKDGDKYDFKCNCPYFKDGSNCKHIVASLFYLEEKIDINNKNEEIKKSDNHINPENNPFIKKDGKFRYYDIGKITHNILFLEKDYEKAKKLVYDKKFNDFQISLEYKKDYHNETIHYVSCYFVDKNLYIETSIRFNRKRIISINCTSDGCLKYHNNFYNYMQDEDIREMKICVHGIALLILLDDYLEQNNERIDSTSVESELLLKQIRESVTYSNNLPLLIDEKKIEMDIEFIYSNHMLYVNFRIGYEKTYMINNINDFLTKMENKENMLFGSKTYILLSEENLSEKSKKLYVILKRYYERMSNMISYTEYGYYGSKTYLIRDIPFVGEFADEIYEYLTYTKAYFKINDRIKREKYYRTISNKDFSITTTIGNAMENDTDEYSISVKIEMPITFFGLNNIFFFDTNLNLCSDKKEKVDNFFRLFIRKEHPLVESSKTTCYMKFTFGRTKISDFYNDVLPLLSLYGKVIDKTSDIIKARITSKTTYLFKIDYQEYLLCSVYKVSGDNQTYMEPNDDLNFDEKDIILCVTKYFPIYDDKKKIFRSETTIDEMYYILGVVVPYYMQIGEVEISENVKKLQKPKKAIINVGVSVKSNLLDLNISTNELSKEEIEDILQAYNKKLKYYKAKNNDIIDIQNSDLEILYKLESVTGLKSNELISKKITLPLYRTIYLNELLKEKNDDAVTRDEKFNSLIEKFESAKKANYELPKNIKATLRDYQINGYKWIKTLDGTGFCGILADEMGLGKTLQVILYFASLYENDEKNISIVIAPASLIYNWKFEFEKFAPNIKIIVIAGLQDERKRVIDDIKNYNVVITSYDLFKRDIDLYKDINFRCVVIDEAQYIKNQTTKVSRSTKIINSQFRLALTGTPIENRLSELWSIFDFLMPDYLYNYSRFKKDFELPIVRDEDENKLVILRKMVIPFILRRKKEEVLKDLPEKIENNYYVQMNEKQSKLYNAEAEKLKKMILTSDYDNDKIVILAQIMKLRQICCDPSLIYDNYVDSSSKKDTCILLIQNAIEDGHKVLVFSQFTSMLDILSKELRMLNIKYYEITGKTNKNERIFLVEKFNNDDVPVFFISLKAGGTGLNLIGADTVIHYDPWWNTSVQNQATDRAHRIGQTKIVNIYKLITKNTIEERIIEMQKMKERITDDILSGEFGGLSKLSKEELIDLINGAFNKEANALGN